MGGPVQAGASGAFAFGLAELLEQRRFELQTLMDRGGVLVMFLHPNIAHPSVTSLPGLERHTLTPSPGAGALGWPALRGGDGKEIRSTAPGHPAAGYLDELSGRLRYRAVWDEQSPAFPAGAEVLARSIGGQVVGAEFRVGAGRLVMLPPPLEPLSTADRKRFTGAVLELLVRLVDEDGAGREPVWVKRYDTEQTEAARAALAAAEAGLREAERRTTESRGALAEVARFSELLWRPAGAKLTALVEDAMRTLGFEVKTGTSGPELTDSDAIALLEVEASDQEVSERVYLTLQRRLEEHFLRRKARPKGHHRRQRPARARPQIPQEGLDAAARQRLRDIQLRPDPRRRALRAGQLRGRRPRPRRTGRPAREHPRDRRAARSRSARGGARPRRRSPLSNSDRKRPHRHPRSRGTRNRLRVELRAPPATRCGAQSLPICSTARNASCGISTLPTRFSRFLPSA